MRCCCYLTLDRAVVDLLTAGAEEVCRVLTHGAPAQAGAGSGRAAGLLTEVARSDHHSLGWLLLLLSLLSVLSLLSLLSLVSLLSLLSLRSHRHSHGAPWEVETARSGEELLNVCAELPGRLGGRQRPSYIGPHTDTRLHQCRSLNCLSSLAMESVDWGNLSLC